MDTQVPLQPLPLPLEPDHFPMSQLWLDFQQFDGFALLSHATGACEDIFAVAGQSAISTPKSNDTELKKI